MGKHHIGYRAEAWQGGSRRGWWTGRGMESKTGGNRALLIPVAESRGKMVQETE